jgi:hypothetical protein
MKYFSANNPKNTLTMWPFAARQERLGSGGNISSLTGKMKARSSGGERYLDTVEVGGSKPPAPIE